MGRWSLDELENGHFVESQSQNASSTLLLARDGATHTRTGVLTVGDVNYLSVSVPNGDCLVNKAACGGNLVVSFWMKLKGCRRNLCFFLSHLNIWQPYRHLRNLWNSGKTMKRDTITTALVLSRNLSPH